ncbi:3-hydroxyisobutyrate dehydrogenase [alpha proteobacterium U9-1i]|nr:3-hydroxyisobutyrate dehydrogenase [alpha proteobacterium U9-1i]
MTRVAFIGLGNMGSGMAANVVKAGHAVSAFDLSADAVARAVEHGAVGASSAAEAVKDADIVITMLPAGQHVRQVYDQQVAPNAKAGALFIDCSTIDVESARVVAADMETRRFRFADAPVSGGTAAAQGGSLTFMVGCRDADFADVERALKPMAKAIIHAGGAGAGQAAKICNNMLLGISMIGTCEAFALAEKLGLDPVRFFDISSKSSGQCWSMTSYCPWAGPVPAAPSNRAFEGGFATAMMLKDLRLAAEAAGASKASTPLGEHARQIYEAFAAEGHGGKDFSAIIEKLRGKL